jgi:hypothetical protein
LEPKTVMSAGLSTAPIAAAATHDGRVAAKPAVLVETHRNASVTLTGEADGTYTSTLGPPDTGTPYKLNASGTITPVGSAVITGSFHTPGFIRGGKVTGRLKIVGSHGTLTLKLTDPGPIERGASNAVDNPINPGGPIRGLRPASGGSPSAAGIPIILVHDFTYTVVKGTGQYAKDHGTGTVMITTTPGLTSPPGPGIYSSPMTTEPGIGRVTVTFESGAVPFAGIGQG